jgi:hypothetical protein
MLVQMPTGVMSEPRNPPCWDSIAGHAPDDFAVFSVSRNAPLAITSP